MAGQPRDVCARRRRALTRLLVLEPAPSHPPPREVRCAGHRQPRAGDTASRAVDGDRGTAWTSTDPGRREMALTVDLELPQGGAGVRVSTGLPGRICSGSRARSERHDLRAPSSRRSPVAGAVYWTGTESPEGTVGRVRGPVVCSPRTTLRYLRLSPAAPFPDPWRITEIECSSSGPVAAPPVSSPAAPRGDPCSPCVVPALLVVGAGPLRALRVAAPFHWPFVWDETSGACRPSTSLRGGLPAIARPELLRGARPRTCSPRGSPSPATPPSRSTHSPTPSASLNTLDPHGSS
jgi:hypothetical protein